jgi:hypothetical protein
VSAPKSPDVEPRSADFYTAAVYGSIIAAALLGAFREEHVNGMLGIALVALEIAVLH